MAWEPKVHPSRTKYGRKVQPKANVVPNEQCQNHRTLPNTTSIAAVDLGANWNCFLNSLGFHRESFWNILGTSGTYCRRREIRFKMDATNWGGGARCEGHGPGDHTRIGTCYYVVGARWRIIVWRCSGSSDFLNGWERCPLWVPFESWVDGYFGSFMENLLFCSCHDQGWRWDVRRRIPIIHENE